MLFISVKTAAIFIHGGHVSMKDNRRARSARGCQDRRSDLCTLLRRSCSRPLLPHSLQAASPVALKHDLTSFSTSCALPCWCYCLERGAAMTRRPQRSSSRCARSPRLIRLLKPCSARRDPPAIQQRKACVFSHLTPRATGLPQSMRARRADRRCLAVWRPARCPARHAVRGARGERWAASSPRRARRSFPMALRSIRALGSSRRTANWPSRISVQAEHVFQAAPRAEPPLPPVAVHATWRLEAPQRIVRAAKGSEHSPPRAAAACAATRRAPWNCLKPADLIQQWFSKIHQWFSKIHQWFY